MGSPPAQTQGGDESRGGVLQLNGTDGCATQVEWEREEVDAMKRALLTVLAGLLVTTAAVAGQNPGIIMGLDASSTPVGVNTATPEEGEIFSIYVVLKSFGTGGGVKGISFRFEKTFGGDWIATTNLLGGLTIGGDPAAGMGCAMTAGTGQCKYPVAEGYVVAARVRYEYTGTSGYVRLIGHATDGQATSDCNNELDMWTDYSHFGVNQSAPPSPVESKSWSAIKALYR